MKNLKYTKLTVTVALMSSLIFSFAQANVIGLTGYNAGELSNADGIRGPLYSADHKKKKNPVKRYLSHRKSKGIGSPRFLNKPNSLYKAPLNANVLKSPIIFKMITQKTLPTSKPISTPKLNLAPISGGILSSSESPPEAAPTENKIQNEFYTRQVDQLKKEIKYLFFKNLKSRQISDFDFGNFSLSPLNKEKFLESLFRLKARVEFLAKSKVAKLRNMSKVNLVFFSDQEKTSQRFSLDGTSDIFFAYKDSDSSWEAFLTGEPSKYPPYVEQLQRELDEQIRKSEILRRTALLKEEQDRLDAIRAENKKRELIALEASEGLKLEKQFIGASYPYFELLKNMDCSTGNLRVASGLKIEDSNFVKESETIYTRYSKVIKFPETSGELSIYANSSLLNVISIHELSWSAVFTKEKQVIWSAVIEPSSCKIIKMNIFSYKKEFKDQESSFEKSLYGFYQIDFENKISEPGYTEMNLPINLPTVKYINLKTNDPYLYLRQGHKFVPVNQQKKYEPQISSSNSNLENGKNKVKIGILDFNFIYNFPVLRNSFYKIQSSIHQGGETVYGLNNPSLTKGIMPINLNLFNTSGAGYFHGLAMSQIVVGRNPNIEIFPVDLENFFRNNIGNQNQETFLLHLVDDLYARGVRIINLSISFDDQWFAKIFEKIISSHPNILFVAAAGNSSVSLDEKPVFPAAINSNLESFKNLIKITQVDNEFKLIQKKDLGSNWSPTLVQLGVVIDQSEKFQVLDYSLNPVFIEGTSAATARTTNLAARILQINPNLSSFEIIQIIKKTITPVDSLNGVVQFGGVLNEEAALRRVPGPVSCCGELF